MILKLKDTVESQLRGQITLFARPAGDLRTVRQGHFLNIGDRLEGGGLTS